MDDCIFCRISRGEIPAARLREDEHLFAIRDINPAAPTHLLLIPHEHIPSVEALSDAHGEIAGRLLLAARDLAREQGLAADGYRLVINTGSDGGQTVPHLHLHLLGGAQMHGHGTA
jgi:histidine triad (HIT) family protein